MRDSIQQAWGEGKGFYAAPPPGLGLESVYLPNAPGRRGTTLYKEWAKLCFTELIRHGYNYSQAAEQLGYKYEQSWQRWKEEDKEWAEEIRRIRNDADTGGWTYPDLSQMTFSQFCKRYFNVDLAAHQLEMEEALTDPMARLVQILGFPESGKSTLVSLWYVLYRLAQNPNLRVALVAKSSQKAEDMLTRVKRYLTERHLYEGCEGNLIDDFRGWKPTHTDDRQWSQKQIFIRHRTSGERDPSIQALGIGKHIYGSRLDLLILDDALVTDNQITETMRMRIDQWFTNEARSRAQKGQTVINGTRLLPFDLYGQWKKSFAKLRTYRLVKMPAILEEYTENERSAWPEYHDLTGRMVYNESTGDEEYVPGLQDIRAEISSRSPARWKLVYQQEDIEETESVFLQRHIDAAFDLGAEYSLGQVFDHEVLILGVDPATTGRAAAILLAFDPSTRVRRVVDIFVGERLGAVGIRNDLFYRFWEKYRDHRIQLSVIETNFVPTLLSDEAFQQRAEVAGTTLMGQWTGGFGNRRGAKWDEEYGIGALASKFSSGLIAFPGRTEADRAAMQPLIDDMIVFPYAEPTGDALIALWVAEGVAGQARHAKVDQVAAMDRRGIPGVVRERLNADRGNRALVASRHGRIGA
jgi:hypothetical protein